MKDGQPSKQNQKTSRYLPTLPSDLQESTSDKDQRRERVAKRLLDERKKIGWTQDDLAEKSGYTQTAISKIERGETAPKAETIRCLCEAMGLGDSIAQELLANHFLTDSIEVQARSIIRTAIVSGHLHSMSQEGEDVRAMLIRYGSRTFNDLALSFNQLTVVLNSLADDGLLQLNVYTKHYSLPDKKPRGAIDFLEEYEERIKIATHGINRMNLNDPYEALIPVYQALNAVKSSSTPEAKFATIDDLHGAIAEDDVYRTIILKGYREALFQLYTNANIVCAPIRKNDLCAGFFLILLDMIEYHINMVDYGIARRMHLKFGGGDSDSRWNPELPVEPEAPAMFMVRMEELFRVCKP